MSSVRPKRELFVAGQTREIASKKQKKPLGSAFDLVPHVSSRIVSMQTFLILLFLWIRQTVKFALLPNKQMHYINLGKLLTSIIR